MGEVDNGQALKVVELMPGHCKFGRGKAVNCLLGFHKQISYT